MKWIELNQNMSDDESASGSDASHLRQSEPSNQDFKGMLKMSHKLELRGDIEELCDDACTCRTRIANVGTMNNQGYGLSHQL